MDTFRKHIYGCFIDDLHGVRNLDVIGVDNVMIETDYPHSDSTWPNCLEHAQKQLEGLSDIDRHKIMRGNAERLFRFTPGTGDVRRESPRSPTGKSATAPTGRCKKG